MAQIEGLEHPLILELEVGPMTPDHFEVYAFEVNERMSSPFEISVTLTTSREEVTPVALVGQQGTLSVFVKGTTTPRIFHGLIVEANEWHAGGAHPRRLRLQFAPRLWRLGQGRRSRIFQNLSVKDIVEKVLSERTIDHEWRVSETYKPRIYCVQYQESDFAFVSRLLEEEGIFYFFEHTPTQHFMVLGDGANVHPAISGNPTVKFRSGGGMVANEDAVVGFATRRSVRPNKVSLRDFNYLTPALNMERSAEAEDPLPLEIYDQYGRYLLPDQGKIFARIRLERERWPREVAEGDSHCVRLSAGHTFALDEHFDIGSDKTYMLVNVAHAGQRNDFGEHSAREDGHAPEYTNRFECIPADVPYRAPRSAPRPVIAGAQTAFVVGPAGEEIFTDEHGRVKVQFHWDREGQRNDSSSMWVRVSQAWAGPGWGALYLPRIGHEVVIEFEHGDPDRPIITGRVYNAANVPPVALPGDKTKSTLRSSSSPGDAGYNELRFEDAAGSELVYLHAQKDMDIVVENDKDQLVKGNEKLVVRKDRSREIQQNQDLLVKGNDDSTVMLNQTLTVNQNRTTTVAGNHTESVGANQDITVGSAHTLTVGLASAETIGGAKALTVGAALTITVGAAMAEVIAGARSEAVEGNKTETIGGKKTETIKGDRSYEVGGNFTETVGKDRSLKVTKDVVVGVEGKHSHAVKKTYALSAKEILLAAKDELTIKVGKASIKMEKNGDITIKGGNIELTGSGDVIVKGSKIGQN